MVNNWFRWERQASLHLLFPTLEVFFTSLKKYSGVSAPSMILIFSKGIVTWCIPERDFIEYGNNLIDVFKDPKKESKMVDDIERALGNLKDVEEVQKKLDLKKLTDGKLIEAHHDLYQAFLNYYCLGAIGTPLSFSAEIILKEKGLTDEGLNVLTTPDEISYVSEADEYLLKTKDINGFIKKYFWIDNNYSGTEVLSADKVRERLSGLRDKSTTAVVQMSPVIKLDNEDKRLKELLKHYSIYQQAVRLLRNFATYKDNRKKEILIYLHYIDSILKEVAKRANLSIDQVRTSTPYEVGSILAGTLSKRQLDKRLKYLCIAWEKNKGKPLLLAGGEGKKWENKTLSAVISPFGDHRPTQAGIHITGRAACPGKVTGRVRILLKAQDCDQMENGEVLVTFMTSPDFMPAIRKASAIITNLGGVTSHAAIISRELNIPCVVGTKIATQVLKTGDMVEVDATTGIVRKLNR